MVILKSLFSKPLALKLNTTILTTIGMSPPHAKTTEPKVVHVEPCMLVVLLAWPIYLQINIRTFTLPQCLIPSEFYLILKSHQI